MSAKNIKKIILVLVIIGIIAGFWIFDLKQYLTLSYIKYTHETLSILYSEHQVLVIGGYMLVYIIMAALSLPGAAVVTIAAGALFGLWTGTLAVSFSSTIGATLACTVSRFLLRDWVQKKFGEKTAKINEGIEREGSFYLFSLRLIPIFPFWMINLVMGVTKMPLRTFYWVSQIGMLPGTIVYVNAGKELAKIDSLSGILSPGLIVSFALLGLFPITVKKLLSWYRAKTGIGLIEKK
ncbi:MAG: TVP38/TMEM64 family protein [bacterium]